MDLFKPVFKKISINHTKGLAIYYYDQTIRENLYHFKGCYDYELYPIFLYQYAGYLHMKYHDYIVVPAPSYYEDNEKRGFNHVERIFSLLNLEIVNLFIKTEHHKQAMIRTNERRDIYKYLKVKDNIDISNKKVLLVDDVFTSGSTMSSMINLVKKMNPKKIEFLVMSKTIC